MKVSQRTRDSNVVILLPTPFMICRYTSNLSDLVPEQVYKDSVPAAGGARSMRWPSQPLILPPTAQASLALHLGQNPMCFKGFR